MLFWQRAAETPNAQVKNLNYLYILIFKDLKIYHFDTDLMILKAFCIYFVFLFYN